MFKTCLIATLILFACCKCKAQNLITNPGFEIYNNCPQDRGEILFSPNYSNFLTAVSWVSALSNSSPDYYNTCAANPLVTLPYNTYNDYQQPHGGEACAGIVAHSRLRNNSEESDYREYIETRLAQPLVAGKKYYLNFFVNMTYHIPESANQIVIDMIGARFTDNQLNVTYPWGQQQLYIDGPPDIFNPRHTYLKDTAAWTGVSGVYTAHGGEQWLTIGYFKDSMPVSYAMLYSPAPYPDTLPSTCYMYIDDVCVTEIEMPGSHTMYVDSFPVDIGAVVQNGHHLWNTGANTTAINVTEPGTYWVTTTGDCFYGSDTITVICNVDTATGTTTIVTSEVPVTMSSSLVKGTYKWNTGDTTAAITVYTPGTYWVEGYYNCRYRADTFIVSCIPDTVRHNETLYAPSFPVRLQAAPDGDSLRWNNNFTVQTRDINEPGIYSVTIWQGCRTYINTTEVIALSGCLWVPSAFTPNGDGKNDNFGPVDACEVDLPFYHFSIYNRFGQCVFETEDINSRWDGNYNGNLADMGAYYYLLRYSVKNKSANKDANDKDIVLQKGDITLLR